MKTDFSTSVVAQNAKVWYSNEELDEFKKIILQKQEMAQKELEYLREQIQDNASNGANNRVSILEGAGEAAEKEHLTEMASRQSQFIISLEMALYRIHNKTYGICRASGKLIPADRLRAVPHATLCIEAKQSRES